MCLLDVAPLNTGVLNNKRPTSPSAALRQILTSRLGTELCPRDSAGTFCGPGVPRLGGSGRLSVSFARHSHGGPTRAPCGAIPSHILQHETYSRKAKKEILSVPNSAEGILGALGGGPGSPGRGVRRRGGAGIGGGNARAVSPCVCYSHSPMNTASKSDSSPGSKRRFEKNTT